jgi:nucleotide-binding universal stress UspA family protein
VTRTVLCAVDRSPGARDVALMARRLHEDLGVRVVLAHVAEDGGGEGASDSVSGRLARTGGERLLERLTREAGLDAADRRGEVGQGARLLARLAAEEGARLILVGARRGRLRGLRSELAERLALETTCPVLLVPPAVAERTGPDAA